MFTKTYEEILDDMLNAVTSDVDKREGSVIYDALAPAALKLAEMYYELNNFVDLVFVDTAVGEYLDRKVAEIGITRRSGRYAIRLITTSQPVPIGSRWGLNGLVYTVTAFVPTDNTKAYAICDTIGEVGNVDTGGMENIDNIVGATAILGSIVSTGYDEESDDELRERYYLKVRTPQSSGNVNDYKRWAFEVSGVGYVSVTPLWMGAGTVAVTVLDVDGKYNGTLAGLVESNIKAQKPIGASVTVTRPSPESVSVSASVVLDGTRTLEEVNTDVDSNILAYIKSTIFETNTISLARVGNALISTSGVSDYNNLLINGNSSNLVIEDGNIPVFTSATLTEV